MRQANSSQRWGGIVASMLFGVVVLGCGGGSRAETGEIRIGDAPVVDVHTSQADIEAGKLSLEEIVERGKALFVASFNTLDGAGRPETTDVGASNTRLPRVFPENFNRISGPDANSCVACHNLPRLGGGGDNATNIFADADRLAFANFDGGAGDGFQAHTLKSVGDERNAAGIFGAGLIELLAREMSVELQGIADEATEEAKRTGAPVTSNLTAKGVEFGKITVRPNGAVDTSQVEGVDEDLIIKPVQAKGHVVSLREFAVKAMNSHFGMQASERFGANADGDDVEDELTRGDLTAIVIFMVTLPPPGRVMPSNPEARAAAERGSELFSTVGCVTCHIPNLRLQDPVFTEPNPFNPQGKLQISEVSRPFSVDLTVEGTGPHIERELDGSVLVPAFTDLKRHDMGDQLDNDMLVQAGVPTDVWLTRKLWGFASEPPFLHHGRATLISEAILVHGGEAQASRDSFAALSSDDQAAIVEFLKTLQVLPEGSDSLVVTAGATAAGGRGKLLAISGGIGVAFVAIAGVVALAIVRRRASSAGRD